MHRTRIKENEADLGSTASVYDQIVREKFYLVTREIKASYHQEFVEGLHVQPEFLKLRGIE